MVTDSRSDDRSRGQVILIGAIALAFIILGVVVVFNGVLYTETLSSGTSSQTASSATVADTEVEQGVGCLLAATEENGFSSDTEIENEIDILSSRYQETNARAAPTVIDIAAGTINADSTNDNIVSAQVTVTYDSHDLSYERTQTIQPTDCPDDDPP